MHEYTQQDDSFEFQSPYNRFSIDNAGNITTNVRLDREDTAQYQLTLIASDTTTNPLFATTMVIIDVDDINDNCPEFDPNVEYDYLLLEEMVHLNFFTPTVSAIKSI